MLSSKILYRLRFFLVSLLGVAIFSVLYIFRELDNNKLASWDWIFFTVNVFVVYAAFVPGFILAYMASHHPLPDRYPALFIFISCFVAAALIWRIPEINGDTARYFSQAKHLALYGIKYFFSEWGGNIWAWTDLPLVPFLYGLIFKIFGENRIFIQIFTTTLFSLTAVLTYLIGKNLWDKETGLCAGAFLLASPHLLMLTPLMNTDVPTMFFLMFAVYACIKALKDGGFWLTVILPIGVVLAFFSKFSTWPMLSVLPVLAIAFKNSGAGRMVAVLGSISAAFAVCFVIVFVKYDLFIEQVGILTGFQGPGLRRHQENWLSPFFFQSHPFMAIAAAFSIYAAFKKRDLKYFAVLWLPALSILFQFSRIRYLLPLLPLVALMASYGLGKIRESELKKFIVFSAATMSVALAVFAYLPYTLKLNTVNLKEAGSFLDSINVKAAEVFILPQKEEINPAISVPLLDLSTKAKISYVEVRGYTPPADVIAKSRFRFSWEYKNPVFYERKPVFPPGESTIVVISKEANDPLPPEVEKKVKGLSGFNVFDTHLELFTYQTTVRVFYSLNTM